MPYRAMAYSGTASAFVALAVAALMIKDRRAQVLGTVTLATAAGPIAWNLILRLTHSTDNFSHDLPFKPFPISWQDTGSGVFTHAFNGLTLALTSTATEPARRPAILADKQLGDSVIEVFVDGKAAIDASHPPGWS